jgi:hypothetical protein
MKNLIGKTLILILIIAAAMAPAGAQKRAEAGETLTKGEAVMLISATDFMKKKIGELLSWTIGYDVSRVNRVRLTPSINYIKAVPRKVPPDGRTVLELLASVDDPGGLKNIAGVRADLSAIGRLPNTMLVDNGLFGDVQPDDGVYTLQTSVSSRIDLGAKDITVAVANKKGWLALARTTLDVRKDPTVTSALVQPERVLANGRTLVTITVKLDNPGRIEDVKEAVADLRAFGLSERAPFGNEGREGDSMAKDDIWTLQFIMPETAAPGTYAVPIEAVNLVGGLGLGRATVTVYQ